MSNPGQISPYVSVTQGLQVTGIVTLLSTGQCPPLTIAQSGSIVNIIALTGDTAVSLPIPLNNSGLRYRFVVTFITGGGGHKLTITTPDGVCGTALTYSIGGGNVVSLIGQEYVAAPDVILTPTSATSVGDYIDFYSNGVNWIVSAWSTGSFS